MKNKRTSFLAMLGLSILLSGILFSILRNDFDLHLVRELPSELSAELLDGHLASVTRWPTWFYSLQEAHRILSPSDRTHLSDTTPSTGSFIELQMDPHKGKWKRFSLIVEVLQYIPQKCLQLKILEDSSHRLTRLFDSLEWTIEILAEHSSSPLSVKAPFNAPLHVRGSVNAHTHHWKGRLFGQIAEKILLNQVFYPNLTEFTALRQPFKVDNPQEQFKGFGF